MFCPAEDTAELWLVELRDTSGRARRLELTGFVEWCVGVSPSPRREFHKLFIATSHDPQRRAIFAGNHMWDVPSKRYGHWNADFPYVSAFACSEPLTGAQGDKVGFLGRYGDPRLPAALAETEWRGSFGRHDDPVAALRCTVNLGAGQAHRLGYTLAVAPTRADTERLLTAYDAPEASAAALAAAHCVMAAAVGRAPDRNARTVARTS